MTIKKETINLPLKDRIKLMDFSKYPNENDITLYHRQFSTFSYLGKKNLIWRSVKNRTLVINVNQIQSHKFGRLNRKNSNWIKLCCQMNWLKVDWSDLDGGKWQMIIIWSNMVFYHKSSVLCSKKKICWPSWKYPKVDLYGESNWQTTKLHNFLLLK